jgi:GT2 family glycosyltransferase
MENNFDLSVIIVNYKSEHFLEKCLGSLYKSVGDKLSLEVIITNNYPEETLEKTKELFPAIKVIPNPKNGGFGQGNNIGARVASGKYLLLLNPDTEILSGSPAEIVAELEKDPAIGAIGACLMTEAGTVQEWSAGREATFWDLVKNNLGMPSSRSLWESEKEVEVDWAAGTVFFIERTLFLGLGGFDENIFMYFEDVDLCQRIKVVGKKIMYDPALKVLHKCGGCYTKEKKNQQKQNYYDSLVYYFKKHRPKLEASLVALLRKLFF